MGLELVYNTESHGRVDKATVFGFELAFEASVQS